MRPPDQLFYDGDLQLPPELILQVVSHLQTHDVLSFSLTCKAFYSLFFPTKQARSTSTMDRFLATLERDQPDLHYCHMCIQLHTWRNKDPIPSIRWSSRRTIWGPDCLFAPHGSDRQGVIYGRLSTAGVCKGLTLNFHDARLVMNFHLYGSNYGRPLSSIEHSDPLAHHSRYVQPKGSLPVCLECLMPYSGGFNVCARVLFKQDSFLFCTVATQKRPEGLFICQGIVRMRIS